MNKTHDCNWCAMTSCGTTVTLKPSSVDPVRVQVEPVTSQVEPVTSQVEPVTSQVEPVRVQVEPATFEVDPVRVQVDPVRVQVDVPSGSLNTNKVRLNETVVPAKFTRYRHPSHCHRLFMIISMGHNYCNNKNCNMNIKCNKTMFRCFRCDYDLCGNCFQLGAKGDPVPLAPDDNDVDETTINPITSWCVDPEY